MTTLTLKECSPQKAREEVERLRVEIIQMKEELAVAENARSEKEKVLITSDFWHEQYSRS